VGCKAGVWQVGLIDGCSVAVSIQTPAPSTPSRIVVDQLRLIVLCNETREQLLNVMMHVISADTKVADTIRYDTHSIGSDTTPIR